jgi:hypothetical protein
VLTSVAGHGHNVAVGLEGRDDAHLVLGRDARKDGDVADSLAQLLGRHLVDGLARQAALLAGRHAQTEVACDRGRRLLGVAGDHDDVDAGRLKGGDGFSDTAPGRVEHSLEAGKDELLADCVRRARAVGHCDDAEPLRRDLGCLVGDLSPQVSGEGRCRGVVLVERGAAVKDGVDRALEVNDLGRAGQGARDDHILGL